MKVREILRIGFTITEDVWKLQVGVVLIGPLDGMEMVHHCDWCN